MYKSVSKGYLLGMVLMSLFEGVENVVDGGSSLWQALSVHPQTGRDTP
jgi:hypothetical protein